MPPASAPVVTRFAPSPTGHLHLGHIYAAQIARDFAKKHGGNYLLRFEDIDTTRVRPHFYEEMELDMLWLGLDWDDTPLRQTERFEHYQDVLNILKAKQVIYPCFCTRKDIERELNAITRAPHGPEGPLYPGTCKKLTEDEINRLFEQGEIPAWRIDSERAKEICGNLSFTDLVHGEIPVDSTLLGDTILARKDIGTSYHIAVVTDDAFQKVSHVTRGKDLLPSTHLHRVLQTLLELPEPQYLHHDLIADKEGKRLAKRHESLSIRSLREAGHSPEEVWKMLSLSPKI